ncbi:MAG: rhomboid family intramembrane serine protease [Actinomycetota bacterium]
MEEPHNLGPAATSEQADIAYCYGHPDTPTKLRCSRCDKPICPRCAVPAAVGQHCVWCVAEARKSQPKVRTAMQANSPAVMTIIAIAIAVYVMEVLFGDDFVLRFAASPANIAYEGEYYRLITPIFLHAPLGTPFGILHILFNMYILRIYGPQVEEAFDSFRFVALFLVTGFTASAVSFAFGSCATLGLGASGAVFGIVGVLLALLYNRRDSTLVADYMKTLLMFIGINLLFGLSMKGVDNFAHIGGLVSGVLLGFGFDGGRAREVPKSRQMLVLLAITALAVGLVAWRISTMHDICRTFIR